MKEEKNVLGAGICGSLVRAFLIVALEGEENRYGLTFWLCHDPGFILLKSAWLPLNYSAVRITEQLGLHFVLCLLASSISDRKLNYQPRQHSF